MKRANNLFPKLVSEENLRLAIFAVNVTHRFHPHHRPNRTVARVEADVDRYVKELREIITGGYEANEPRLARRWDKSAGKWRDISEPKLWPDQYVHHAVIQVLEPIMSGHGQFLLREHPKPGHPLRRSSHQEVDADRPKRDKVRRGAGHPPFL